MSVPKAPQPAKLVIGFFMKETALFPEVFRRVEHHFGQADIVSRWFDFDYTDYYEQETGRPLFRRMVAFKTLIDQGSFPGIKAVTNTIEADCLREGRRRVNIDPGYLLGSRFVLATGKDYAHRIYIGGHMYADLTLIYKNGDFRPLEWTYPDYAARQMRDLLLKIRRKYLLDLKGEFS